MESSKSDLWMHIRISFQCLSIIPSTYGSWTSGPCAFSIFYILEFATSVYSTVKQHSHRHTEGDISFARTRGLKQILDLTKNKHLLVSIQIQRGGQRIWTQILQVHKSLGRDSADSDFLQEHYCTLQNRSFHLPGTRKDVNLTSATLSSMDPAISKSDQLLVALEPHR